MNGNIKMRIKAFCTRVKPCTTVYAKQLESQLIFTLKWWMLIN
jgi:hypothetical protein